MKPLKINKTINAISLSCNNIESDDMKDLADVLQTNKTIRYLSLNGNKIDSSGAIILAAALNNSSILSISLHDNNIGFEGMSALKKTLETNYYIEYVGLSVNYVYRELVDEISFLTRLPNRLKRMGWNPNYHYLWNDNTKNIIQTIMLVRNCLNNILQCMSREILYNIFMFLFV